MREAYKQQLTRYYQTDDQYFLNLDEHFAKHQKEYIAQLPRKAFQGKLVLEAGCGSGAMGDWVERNWGAGVVGVDLSLFSLQRARKKYAPHFVQSDLESLPFKEGTFDTVLLFDVLEHIVYPDAMFKEFFRVLKKGGVLVIVSPNLMFNPRVPLKIKMLEAIDYLRPRSGFRFVEPLTDGCACGDQEATLITNPVKVMRALRRIGFGILQGSKVRCRIVARK